MCPETVMLPQKRPVAQGGRARGVSPGVTVNQISDGIQASVLRVEWGPRPRLLQARTRKTKHGFIKLPSLESEYMIRKMHEMGKKMERPSFMSILSTQV